ncbi:MAG: CRISPR-associated protein Cas4 [Bacteroidota bacterium]
MYSDEDLLMLSGIQHFAFCERQWALIHIEQQWAENVRTVEGHHLHERVDDPFNSDKRGDTLTFRSFPLISRKLGFTGRSDVVELKRTETGGVPMEGYQGKWLLHPVEYKRGKLKPDDRDIVQVCAQAMCLEEMYNTKIYSGSLYYAEVRRRTIIEFDEEIKERVIQLSISMHNMFESGTTPSPVYKSHCRSCSLIDICLPQRMAGRISASDYLNLNLEDF